MTVVLTCICRRQVRMDIWHADLERSRQYEHPPRISRLFNPAELASLGGTMLCHVAVIIK